ncbi:hypothetical protein V8F20_005075 [Naviculisporaceae sp. PSN 640]
MDRDLGEPFQWLVNRSTVDFTTKDEEQLPDSEPGPDIHDHPLPTYYWPHNFIRFPLGSRPRGQGPRGGYACYTLPGDNHARWETNAYHYLVGDGGRAAYNLKDIQTVVYGPRPPALKEKVEGWLDVDSLRLDLEYQSVPDESSEKYYPKDGFSTIFRNQLKRWLQFRAWQASNRDYYAAKARRHAEFVDQHIQDTDLAKSLLDFKEQKRLAKEEYDRLKQEEKYKGTQKAVREKHLLGLFKDNFVWDNLSTKEWMKLADEVFENEIEEPHYREVLKLAGIDYEEGFDLKVPDPHHSNEAGIYTWGFDYIRDNLAEVLDRNIRADMKTEYDHLPLDHLKFQQDPWTQDFFTTWVEYVYYECRTLEVLQDCLGPSLEGLAGEFQTHADAVTPFLRPGDTIDSIATAEHRDAREYALRTERDFVRSTDGGHVRAKIHKLGNLDTHAKNLDRAIEAYDRERSYVDGIERFLSNTQKYHKIKQTLDRQTKVRNWAVKEMFRLISLSADGRIDLTRIVRTPSSPKPMELLRNSHTWNWSDSSSQEKKKRTGPDVTVNTTPRKSRRLAGEEPEFYLLPESSRRRGKKQETGVAPILAVAEDNPPDPPIRTGHIEPAREERSEIMEHVDISGPSGHTVHAHIRAVGEQTMLRVLEESTSRTSGTAVRLRVPEQEPGLGIIARAERIMRASRFATSAPSQHEEETRVGVDSSSSDSDLNDLREAVTRKARETSQAKARTAATPEAASVDLVAGQVGTASPAPTESTKPKRRRNRPSKKFRLANPRL